MKLAEVFERHSLGSTDLRVQALPGDAGNRRYSRIFDQKNNRSFILMEMTDPEAFKSEEASASHQPVAKELDFVTIGRWWKKSGVRVPEIFYVAPDSRVLVLEDFGDELLFLRRQKEASLDLYEAAIEELVKIQSLHTQAPAKDRSFNKELLHWETEHFMEYALLKRGLKISDKDAQQLRNFFATLVDEMAISKPVLVHRDFHSKNLLILNSAKIGVIDFQDALMGPNTYDLASLLRDSYVKMSDQEEASLIEAYEKTSGKKLNQKLFDYTSLQRNLKAAGRFFYISMVKKKNTHLPFVKPTMLRIFRTLDRLKENEIKNLLESLMERDLA